MGRTEGHVKIAAAVLAAIAIAAIVAGSTLGVAAAPRRAMVVAAALMCYTMAQTPRLDVNTAIAIATPSSSSSSMGARRIVDMVVIITIITIIIVFIPVLVPQHLLEPVLKGVKGVHSIGVPYEYKAIALPVQVPSRGGIVRIATDVPKFHKERFVRVIAARNANHLYIAAHSRSVQPPAILMVSTQVR
jgi:hypothetical protein